MHHVTVTWHSVFLEQCTQEKRHTPRHIWGQLISFCCLLTSQTNLHKKIDTHQSVTHLVGSGIRLYDNSARAELDGYATNNIGYIVGLRHRQRFMHNLPVSATVSYAPTKLRIYDKAVTVCDHRTSPLRITLELLSLEPCGYLHMYAYGKSNTHCRRRFQLWGECLRLRHHIMTS